MTDIAYPLHVDGRGRTAEAAHAAHVRDLIEQVVFTAPGERVNRPDFGSSVLQSVFAPNSDSLAAATQAAVHGALQRWLGDLIAVDAVEVQAEDAALQVTVRYLLRRTQQPQTAQLTRRVP